MPEEQKPEPLANSRSRGREPSADTYVVSGPCAELEAWLAPKGWHIDFTPNLAEPNPDTEFTAWLHAGRGPAVQLVRAAGGDEPYLLAYAGETLVWDGRELEIQGQDAQTPRRDS